VKRILALKHEFVQYVPEVLEEGTLYVSFEYATAAHRCCCGCGNQVITPLSPTDWTLTFDGESVTLHPSIGNWSLPCQSHYWIRNNRTSWAGPMSKRDVDLGRARDLAMKKRYYTAPSEETCPPSAPDDAVDIKTTPKLRVGLWAWLKSWFS